MTHKHIGAFPDYWGDHLHVLHDQEMFRQLAALFACETHFKFEWFHERMELSTEYCPQWALEELPLLSCEEVSVCLIVGKSGKQRRYHVWSMQTLISFYAAVREWYEDADNYF
jgi:hypothetical protein